MVTAAALGYAAASLDRCGDWSPRPPTLKAVAASRGPLRAGAAKAAFAVPPDVVLAGYGLRRPHAQGAEPLHARALYLESAGTRLGLVSLDVLLIPPGLTQRVQEAAADLGLSGLLLFATHTHSSLGGLDRRTVSALTATGTFREDVEAALAAAAVQALRAAASGAAPANLELAEGALTGEVTPRSGDEVDPRLQRARFVGQAPIAQLVVLAAHPTLAPRSQPRLSADYPGALSAGLEAQGQGITLVLQGAGGNASGTPSGDGAPEAMAKAVAQVLGALPTGSQEGTPALSLAQVAVALPRPEVDRAVPAGARGIARNAVCGDAPREVELTFLQLGAWRFLALPFEVTRSAGRALEDASGARTLSLANGYLGYLESPALIQQGAGEARRQLFPESLLGALTEGASLGGATLSATRRD